MRLVLMILVAFVLPVLLTADDGPRFANIFSDEMVIQQGEPIHIWGFADPDLEGLSVEFGVASVSVKVDSSGRWVATFPEASSSEEGRSLRLLDSGKLIQEVKNVVVGEVWIAAGQSNMQWRVGQMLKDLPESQKWIDSADFPTIRVRRINDPVLDNRKVKAVDIQDGDWVAMTSESVVGFSAIAAAFSRDLNQALDIPIGIIEVSWGGKPIEPFIPLDQYDQPILKDILKLSNQEQLDELRVAEGGVVIRNPQGYPAAIYHARISPVMDFPVRGVIWYQGESNAGKGEDPRWYRNKMAALVEGWRKDSGNRLMPFYLVQLPSYQGASGWIRMREEQRLAAKSIVNSELVVTIDLPGKNIHPPHKLPVGNRLANLALEKTYGKKVAGSSPRVKRIMFQDSQVILDWENIGKGLSVGNWQEQHLVTKSTVSKLKWFEVADESGRWWPAKVTLGEVVNQIKVSSLDVNQPKAVRYGCAMELTDGLLYNSVGLPASPFCSRLDWLPWQDSK